MPRNTKRKLEINFDEFFKLESLCSSAGWNFKSRPWFDGWQLQLLDSKGEIVDDATLFSGSHGYEQGLLETFCLGECDGYETADKIFKGWKKMIKNLD